MAEQVGSQSVIVVLDIRKNSKGDYEIFTHNGQRPTGKCPIDFAQQLVKLGAGEIVINSIDQDGEMKGYDLVLAEKIREKINVPMTVLGGCGSLQHLGQLINKFGIIGAAAGSLFVFKGIYKAVLINYPNKTEKNSLIKEHHNQP
jgi:cyclase